MTTVRGEIARSEPGRLQEQLAGRVWLGQNRGEWPVTLMTSEAHVIQFLRDPDAVVWEYEVMPVRAVEAITPEPYLAGRDTAGGDHV